MGSTKDPNLREPGHANSSLPLARIYSFPTLAVAEAVEKAIHNWLRAECSFSKTGRGFFVMPYDNTLDRIDAYVNQHHRWLLRNTGAVS